MSTKAFRNAMHKALDWILDCILEYDDSIVKAFKDGELTEIDILQIALNCIEEEDVSEIQSPYIPSLDTFDLFSED